MDFDPRDRDGDARDIDMPWVELEREREPDRDPYDSRGRDEGDADPRDVFARDLELPRGPEREIVLDGDHRYELNGDDVRTLATVGAFRVVAERDLRESRDELETRDPDVRHLRDEKLIESVRLDSRDRVLTLTERGRHLLESHRRDRDDDGRQAFQAGVSRARCPTTRSSIAPTCARWSASANRAPTFGASSSIWWKRAGGRKNDQ